MFVPNDKPPNRITRKVLGLVRKKLNVNTISTLYVQWSMGLPEVYGIEVRKGKLYVKADLVGSHPAIHTTLTQPISHTTDIRISKGIFEYQNGDWINVSDTHRNIWLLLHAQ